MTLPSHRPRCDREAVPIVYSPRGRPTPNRSVFPTGSLAVNRWRQMTFVDARVSSSDDFRLPSDTYLDFWSTSLRAVLHELISACTVIYSDRLQFCYGGQATCLWQRRPSPTCRSPTFIAALAVWQPKTI